jgi:hypothetical protein
MTKLGRRISSKATKATVRHSINGLASKAQRRPLRSITLLTIGAAGGLIAGVFIGQKTG